MPLRTVPEGTAPRQDCSFSNPDRQVKQQAAELVLMGTSPRPGTFSQWHLHYAVWPLTGTSQFATFVFICHTVRGSCEVFLPAN